MAQSRFLFLSISAGADLSALLIYRYLFVFFTFRELGECARAFAFARILEDF